MYQVFAVANDDDDDVRTLRLSSDNLGECITYARAREQCWAGYVLLITRFDVPLYWIRGWQLVAA
jgi:hypothetical protein